MMSRKALADAIDDLDEQISELQRAKADTFAAYREQLATLGRTKEQARIEMEATKSAIRRRQKVAKKGSASVDEMDALIGEILAEIQRPPGAGTIRAIARDAREVAA